MVRYITISANTREAWLAAYRDWLDTPGCKSDQIIVTVLISAHQDNETYFDVANLRYFFPLEDAIYERCPNAIINLHVNHLSSDDFRADNSQEEAVNIRFGNQETQNAKLDDRNRIYAFLSFCLHQRSLLQCSEDRHLKPITFFVDGGDPLKKESIQRSRISPLFEVYKDKSLTFSHLEKCYFDSTINRNIVEAGAPESVVCRFANSIIDGITNPNSYVGTSGKT